MLFLRFIGVVLIPVKECTDFVYVELHISAELPQVNRGTIWLFEMIPDLLQIIGSPPGRDLQ